MGLEHRVTRLEAAARACGVVRPCAGCGHSPGEPERYVLSPIDLDDDDRPPPGPDACSTCGRRLVVRMGPINLDELV